MVIPNSREGRSGRQIAWTDEYGDVRPFVNVMGHGTAERTNRLLDDHPEQTIERPL